MADLYLPNPIICLNLKTLLTYLYLHHSPHVKKAFRHTVFTALPGYIGRLGSRIARAAAIQAEMTQDWVIVSIIITTFGLFIFLIFGKGKK
jgi:hypothetical protein